MNRLRRRRLSPELEPRWRAFSDVLREIEPAKAALAGVMPTTRMPGRALPDALLDFEDRLARADDLMPGWRCPQTEDVWTVCESGIAEARTRAQRLREDAPELGGFEGLIWAVEHLMDPLGAFEGAATRFGELKV
jgi:hypothetical protein